MKAKMILKQPGRGNVVAQFLPNELILILQDTKKRTHGFSSGGLTILICVEASMLAALIRKMFQLSMFPDIIWRNVAESV